ncbi:MAG: ATP-binding cassette domain-containing protein [Acidobacteria bacterium]|nr:ATP-binding cassette domain-containing protein [Acidobacteriota bacterium]
MLRLEQVTKTYGARPAVDALSLEVPEGELLAILGPSGCGKTTLLRILGGYEAPDSGRVWIAGADATEAPPERRNLGMVFQSYALFPHMTALENVEFGLRMRGVGKTARRERAEQALRLTGLNGEASRRPAQLSGGEQQRVAVARALVVEPRALLMDEPFANLDRNVRLRLRDELKALQARLGLTTVFVTHDHEEALALADRIAVMNHGRIEQIAPALQLFLQPANAFVARFLGVGV